MVASAAEECADAGTEAAAGAAGVGAWVLVLVDAEAAEGGTGVDAGGVRG